MNYQPMPRNVAEQRRPQVIILFQWTNENTLENEIGFLPWNYTQYFKYFETLQTGILIGRGNYNLVR